MLSRLKITAQLQDILVCPMRDIILLRLYFNINIWTLEELYIWGFGKLFNKMTGHRLQIHLLVVFAVEFFVSFSRLKLGKYYAFFYRFINLTNIKTFSASSAISVFSQMMCDNFLCLISAKQWESIGLIWAPDVWR